MFGAFKPSFMSSLSMLIRVLVGTIDCHLNKLKASIDLNHVSCSES